MIAKKLKQICKRAKKKQSETFKKPGVKLRENLMNNVNMIQIDIKTIYALRGTKNMTASAQR